jgi:phosphoesterase RecJ-like protein
LLGDFDLIVILDCGDARRTGFPIRIKKLSSYKNKIINIDHHPKNDLHKLAKINFVDYNTSSTSEIIYRIIKKLKIKIDKDIALCLLCGLYTDTGSFMHSNTSSETLKIASDLLRCGARFRKVTENVVNSHSLSALKLRGIALSRLKINQKYKIATSILDQNDIKKCQASSDDVAGIVNMICTIPEAKIALLMYQKDENTIKGSLRTEESGINLTRMAQLFGGGGLKKASGFTINGKLIIKGNNFQIQYT